MACITTNPENSTSYNTNTTLFSGHQEPVFANEKTIKAAAKALESGNATMSIEKTGDTTAAISVDPIVQKANESTEIAKDICESWDKAVQDSALSFGHPIDNAEIRGWICPRCGRANSPYIKHCDCSPPEKSNYDSVDYRYYIDWVKSPTVTVPDRMVYTGNACKNCPTNPANGGDGNCNCILGDYNKVTC